MIQYLYVLLSDHHSKPSLLRNINELAFLIKMFITIFKQMKSLGVVESILTHFPNPK